MAQSRVQGILDKVRSGSKLSDEELTSLQTVVDALERVGRSSHHDTTSHHHTSALAQFEEI